MKLLAFSSLGIAAKQTTFDAAPWTPAALGSALALWLDASDASTITLSGSNVSQWDDKSGNGNHAVQAIAANQPTYTASVLNGQPGLTFDGSDDFMTVAHDNALNAQLAPSSVVVLYREKGGFRIMQKGTGSGTSAAGFFVAASAVFGPGGTYTTSYDTNQNTWNIDVGTFSSGVVRHWRNSTKLVPTNVFGGTIVNGELVSGTTPEANSDPLFIGKRDNPGGSEGHLDGEIMDIFVLTAALSNSDRQNLEGYLAHKWGLTYALPPTHPYKWDTSLFGGSDLSGFDADAKTYITAVETADQLDLEPDVRTAINDFVVGLKADGIWNAIKASTIMAGARTLSGALVPLKGTAPTNFNFVAGDYNRETGLKGDGATKYLDSNRNNNADPQDSKHLAVYFGEALSNNSAEGRSHMGVVNSSYAQTGASLIFTDPASIGSVDSGRYRVNGSTPAIITSGLAIGLKAASRSNSSSIISRQNSISVTTASTSEAQANANLFVFARNAILANQGVPIDNFSNARLSFYSIGESLDLADLDSRVSTLMTDLGNAIP